MKISAKDLKNFIKEKPAKFLIKELKNLYYDKINHKDEQNKILEIVKVVFEKKILKSGKSYKKKWDTGWMENYIEYKKSKKFKELIPKYFFKSKISRIGNQLIKTRSKNFDYKILRLITLYVFDKYLKKEKNIVEFGCGTGHNLVTLSKINPVAKIYGLDWSKSSQKILKLLKNKIKNIYGYSFDYFNPLFQVDLKNNFSCFTVASLEQVGRNFHEFIKFLQKKNPNIIINIEPITELMSENKLLDYMSIKYCQRRNYLDGYYTYLKNLERKKIIKIIEEKKSYFGSHYINGYAIIVWKFIR